MHLISKRILSLLLTIKVVIGARGSHKSRFLLESQCSHLSRSLSVCVTIATDPVVCFN